MRHRHVRALALLVTAVLLLGACGNDSDEAGGPDGEARVAATTAGSGAPAFEAQTLAGTDFDSASFDGRPTVLWFWAPWCTVCRAEAPDVIAAAADHADEVQLVGVAGRGEIPDMKEFVEQTGTDGFTHVVDDDGSIWSDYDVAAQPAFAFIDGQGNVDVHVGSLGRDALTERMQALAAG